MVVNKNIDNLNGGVSQQPDESRFYNQVETMENIHITVSEGERRRNPVELIRSLGVTPAGIVTTHSYDRGDDLEKYFMLFDDNGLKSFDINDGTERVVNIVGDNPLSTWASGTNGDWKANLDFLTVNDTTWILNNAMKVTASTPIDTVEENKAFFWVKKSFDNGASSGYDYRIDLTVGGVTQTFTDNDVSTIGAISALKTAIDGVVINGVTFTAVADISILKITATDEFSFSSGDSFGNQASTGWRDNVRKVEDLPLSMNSFTSSEVGVIAIVGTDRDNFTLYYLAWNEDGYWYETVRPNRAEVIDYRTMPAKAVRQSDGTFSFGFNIIDDGHDLFDKEWKERRKGDEDSNPSPSFIGNTIDNMFFFKNRLCFTSSGNVIMSEIGRYYNFYATTAMEVLDGDPIDAGIDSNDVALIRNVNPSGGAVTLWADDAQFLLAGGEVLSPATTRISQTSNYSCDNSISPVVVDNEIIFFNKIGNYVDVLSYAPASIQSDKSSAESIASHIPSYIPADITDAVVSSSDNMLFLYSANSTREIYVYKYHVKGQEKLISSWSKWTFGFDIHSMFVLGGTLYMIADTDKFCKIELKPKGIDDAFLDFGSIVYESKVIMSKFSTPSSSSSKTQNIKDDFFMKNIVVSFEGDINLDIINKERDLTFSVPAILLDRKQYISGTSKNVRIGFSSSSANGFKLNSLNVEGRIETKSRSF